MRVTMDCCNTHYTSVAASLNHICSTPWVTTDITTQHAIDDVHAHALMENACHDHTYNIYEVFGNVKKFRDAVIGKEMAITRVTFLNRTEKNGFIYRQAR